MPSQESACCRLMCAENTTEIPQELMTKLERKARKKGVSVEQLIIAAVESSFAKPATVRGSYPSGDND